MIDMSSLVASGRGRPKTTVLYWDIVRSSDGHFERTISRFPDVVWIVWHQFSQIVKNKTEKVVQLFSDGLVSDRHADRSTCNRPLKSWKQRPARTCRAGPHVDDKARKITWTAWSGLICCHHHVSNFHFQCQTDREHTVPAWLFLSLSLFSFSLFLSQSWMDAWPSTSSSFHRDKIKISAHNNVVHTDNTPADDGRPVGCLVPKSSYYVVD